MVLTRSSAKRIEPRKAPNGGGMATAKETVIGPPPRNRAPTSVKKRRVESTTAPKKRRRAQPGEICQLNLDVLFLLAEYIHPIDLLNLARTCKPLRQLLMDKSSAFVWKAARRQIKGLPDCPFDLTEPEYANLVFYARCHGCGKYAKTVLWEMRLRYCLDCKVTRLCAISICPGVIHWNDVLAREQITVEGETTIWIDREQMESFMHEHKHSSDEQQFLKEKKEKYQVISLHARQCAKWQMNRMSQRKADLRVLRQERQNGIVERLRQLGFAREIAHFGLHEIKLSCKPIFGKSKPLTDREWDRIRPKCAETMNNFRSKRLEDNVYRPRRYLLASKYADFVMHPSTDTSVSDLLPHVADVACFTPFKSTIEAPEGSDANDKPFESAFVQLPELVDKWRKTLDAEVAELIKIPSHLSLESASPATASDSTTNSEASQTATGKLRLACALFHGGTRGLFTHPEVFSTTMCNHRYPRDERPSGSISDQYGIEYIEEAPYVIRACGLDPSTATAADMDRREALLQCLACKGSCVWRWRDAVWHAHSEHGGENRPTRSKSLGWQVVNDEDASSVLPPKEELRPGVARCLLCMPHVGDAMSRYESTWHLMNYHNVEEVDIQENIQYVLIGMTPRNAY